MQDAMFKQTGRNAQRKCHTEGREKEKSKMKGGRRGNRIWKIDVSSGQGGLKSPREVSTQLTLLP